MINEKDFLDEMVLVAENEGDFYPNDARGAANKAFKDFIQRLREDWRDEYLDEVILRVSESWDAGDPIKQHYTASELEDMETIHSGQYDNLKIDTGLKRVWLSRLTVADGQPYDNQVTVESLIDGRWIKTQEYQG